MCTNRSLTICRSLLRGGGLPGLGGLPDWGSPWSWGVSLVRGSPWSWESIPACTEADPPPVNRMTNRCKNITLATTSLRPVIMFGHMTKCPINASASEINTIPNRNTFQYDAYPPLQWPSAEGVCQGRRVSAPVHAWTHTYLWTESRTPVKT